MGCFGFPAGSARKAALAAAIAVIGAAVLCGEGYATTADGTVITNRAAVAYYSADSGGMAYAVSYMVTATFIVNNPCLNLQKTAFPKVQVAGGEITFCLWVVNCSGMSSAFQIYVTDRMPGNTEYNANYSSWNGGSGGTWSPYSSPDNMTYSSGMPAVGQDAPYYLRWVLDLLGPARSAYVCYQVKIL